MDDLARQHCHPVGPVAALTPAQVAALLERLPGWSVSGGRLCRRFAFADFHRTMAFVNAVAWVAHEQDHHPDLAVSYGSCTVSYATHSAGAITLNDFVCAARIDALLERPSA
jgi:4a-hydroxytetrahydrobiopterin dehydratase